MPFQSLASRIQAVVVVLLILAAAALEISAGSRRWTNLLAERGGELSNSVGLNGKRLSQAIETLREDTLFLARTPPVSGIMRASLNDDLDPIDNDSTAKWIRRLNEIFSAFAQSHPDYMRISYINMEKGGREMVRVERRHDDVRVVPGGDLQESGDRAVLTEAAAVGDGEVFLSDVRLGDSDAPGSGPPHMLAAIPVRMAGGRLFGIVCVDFDLRSVLAAVTRGLPFAAGAGVFDAGGRRLSSSSESSSEPDPSAVPKAFRDGEASGHLDFQPMIVEGRTHFVTAERVAFDPRRRQRHLFLVYGIPEGQLRAGLTTVSDSALVAGLLLMAAAGSLLLLVVSRIFQPLRQITAAARAVTEGRDGFSLPVTAAGEVGALARAFTVMSARIREREEDYGRLTAELEQRVRARTGQLRLAGTVVQNTSEGVMITDAAGMILSVNPAFSDITGYGPEEVVGRNASLLKSDHHDAAFYDALWSVLLRDGRWQGEIWNRRRNGEAFVERLSINRVPGEDGTAATFVGVFSDVTEQRRKDERIRHLAFHDALTDLPNRYLLQDRLDHAISRARREERSLAVMFIDLDHFKTINDTLGHDVGDLLLRQEALRLRAALREVDTVARMGGDEFL
ncbi:MAG TPA: diguanylate cyclase, partial [Rhodospirillaceae bacterium]|nr:diguanylate cyclase [Rhodospirillaceae bacterium]